jgi:NAD(P)H-dependent FMN reductase
MKTLVVCDGTPATKRLASDLASALRADLDLIITRQPRDGLVGWIRSAYDVTFERPTDIARPARKVDDYDLVVIGSPVWNGAVTSPVRTYIERHAKRVRSLALFATSPRRGAESAIEQMTNLCGRHPLAHLVVRDCDVSTNDTRIAIASFAQRVVMRASRPPVAA